MFGLSLYASLAFLIFGATNGPPLLANPVAPSFSNPFNDRGYVTTSSIGPQSYYWEYPTTNVSKTSCNNVTYYNCVNEGIPDFDSSYVSLRNFNNTPNQTLAFIDFGVYADVDWTRFSNFTVDVWCRWNTVGNSGNKTVVMEFYESQQGGQVEFTLMSSIFFVCTSTTIFQRFTLIGAIAVSPTDAHALIQIRFGLANSGPSEGSQSLEISTIISTLWFKGNPQCTGNGFFGDLSCQFQNFGNAISDAIHLLINVVVFIFSWAGFVVTFLTNFLIIIKWLYAIPGIPFEVQLFLSGYITALFGIIVLQVIKILRGGSP